MIEMSDEQILEQLARIADECGEHWSTIADAVAAMQQTADERVLERKDEPQKAKRLQKTVVEARADLDAVLLTTERLYRRMARVAELRAELDSIPIAELEDGTG